MDRSKWKPPRRRDDRIILHFDYDCFYAQVIENQQPALKSLPLGIKQKSILATCNYVARRRGVKKLMGITEAKKICPDLVLADGEDLSGFRDVSKKLCNLLTAYSWNKKVERLGLDEVFLDVTDLVAYNVPLLNRNSLSTSFFYLSQEDLEQGFLFDASEIAGCVSGTSRGEDLLDNELYVRLLLASHLARYLRLKIEEEGYTSACGISTNKLLSKLAGTKNKPRNQTLLLSLRDADVSSFMGTYGLRQVPGIGCKITYTLESHILGREANKDTYTQGSAVSVGEALNFPTMSPQLLDKLLGGPGSQKGTADKVWALLHGVDDTEVKSSSPIPTQISIEDTYRGIKALSEITREMKSLSASLIRRMHVDLLDGDGGPETQGTQKWMAHPKTLRLTTRPYFAVSENKPYDFKRASRSQPLPNFLFSLSSPREELAQKLVDEFLLPMFYKLNPERESWNIGLINICAANMVLSGTDDSAASGRDISVMFKRQDVVLKEFRVYEESQPGHLQEQESTVLERDSEADDGLSDFDDSWNDDRDGTECCGHCGHYVPLFALNAHSRYHMLGA